MERERKRAIGKDKLKERWIGRAKKRDGERVRVREREQHFWALYFTNPHNKNLETGLEQAGVFLDIPSTSSVH
jgi:hypothetical protein